VRQLDGFRAQVVSHEVPTSAECRHTRRARARERIDHELPRQGTLFDQYLADGCGFFRGITAVDAWALDHVGLTQVVELAFTLLEKQHELVTRTIVVTHADLALVPDQWLPK